MRLAWTVQKTDWQIHAWPSILTVRPATIATRMAFDQITQQPRRFLPSLTWGILLAVVASASSGTPATDPPWWLSPTALVAPSDGKVLYLACATAGQVAL